MKKILLINALLLLFSTVCLAQDKTRIIGFPEEVKSGDFLKNENERTLPCSNGAKLIEIVEIKIKDQVITLDKHFIFEDDWLKYLTIRLKNISDKPISYIKIDFHQPQTAYADGRSFIGFMMKFGNAPWEPANSEIKSIQPNEEIELSRNETSYLFESAYRVEKTGISSINTVYIGMTRVQFEDESVAWGCRLLPVAQLK